MIVTEPNGIGFALGGLAGNNAHGAGFLQAALDTGFMAPSSRLRERWRRLFSRVPAMEREEVNIMRGLLKALMSKRNS